MKYIILFLLLLSQLQAVPAFGGIREFKQADGSTFKATAKGNQHLNWIESADGEILKYNPKTKNYELAEIKYNNLSPSGQVYSIPQAKGKRQAPKSLKRVNKLKMYELWQKRQSEHRAKMGYSNKH